MYRSVRFLIGAVACAMAFTTASCTADEKPPEDPFDPLPEVHHELPKPPADKNPHAVMASLRAIDPCALLEKVRSPDDEPLIDNPNQCAVALPKSYAAVTATVGVYLTANSHAGRSSREKLAGVKAYVDPDDSFCTVAIPVSFERAITLEVENHDRSCAAARSAATSAVRAVRQKKAASTGRPLAQWDACSLLRRSVNSDEGVGRPEPEDPMNQCKTRDWRAELELDYSWPASERGGLQRTVNGTEVFGSRGGTSKCQRAFAGGGDSTIVVKGQSCALADRITSRAIAAFAGPPPRARPLTGRLFYRAGEPDSAALGRCSDLPDQGRQECEPYVEVDVPDDPAELIQHAEADPNVNCSMAADAVRKHFGDSLEPVTATLSFGIGTRGCVFVDGGTTQVWVQLSREPRGTPTMLDNVREPKIAGHSAISGSFRKGEDRELFIALDEPDDPGSLFVAVATAPASRTDRNPPPVVPRPLQRLDAFATTLVEQHL